jgi:hypothetical protein
MKRYIYIILGIVAAAAIAILVLFVIKGGLGTAAPSTTGTGSLPETGTPGGDNSGIGTGSPIGTLGLPPITTTSSASSVSGQMAVQNFGVLSNLPALDYFVDAQNNITVIEPTGEVANISNGQSIVINSSTIDNIISASFSYDGKKILVSYGDPTNPNAGTFTVTTKAWTPLPQGMLSPQWSPINNYQIAYFAVTKIGALTLATVDATNIKGAPKALWTFNADDLALQWPGSNEFIISDKPTSQNAGSIWALNLSAGTLTPLLYEVTGGEGAWSHDAAIPYGLLFSNNGSGQGKTLQLKAISGNLATQPLAFLTLPSKCAFNPEQMPVATSTTTTTAPTSTTSSTVKSAPAKNAPTSTPYLALYCGVPRSSSGFSSANLPDDYNMMSLFTSDDIYKINTATGAEQTLWSDTSHDMDVSDVKFFNNALFFVNRYDQRLYGLTFGG